MSFLLISGTKPRRSAKAEQRCFAMLRYAMRYATLCNAMRPYISLATEHIEIPIPRPKVFSSWCPGITFTAKNGADPILLLGKMADPNGSNSAPPRIQFFTLVFAADPILTRF